MTYEIKVPKTFNELADFWRNQIGVNTIPADTKNKKPTENWNQYQILPVPETQHKQWKQENEITKYTRISPEREETFNELLQKHKITKEESEYRIEINGSPVRQIENYLNTVVKNDRNLVRKLLRVCFSTYTKNPINLGIMAESSDGKSYAATQVTSIFPPEDVIFIGSMSPTALIHQYGERQTKSGALLVPALKQLDSQIANTPERKAELVKKRKEIERDSKEIVDLSNKILVFTDTPDIYLWKTLKPILSHDKREMEYRTTRGDGSLTVKETIISGWPAVIFCSAKNEKHEKLWDEIETRFDITSTNSSTAKYTEANQFTALKMGIPDFAQNMVVSKEDLKFAKYYVETIKENLHYLHILNDNPIWNPFAKIIGKIFPSSEGIEMRHCTRFLSYCNIETLINAERNYMIIFRTNIGMPQNCIITSMNDICSTIEIVDRVSVVPPQKLNFVNDIIKPCAKESVTGEVSSDILAGKFKAVYGKPTTPKKILENYLEPLRDYGILEYRINQDNKRQKLYRISSEPNTNSYGFIREKIIEESNNDPLYVWEGIKELEKYSINQGKLECVLDPEGYPIGHNLIQQHIIKLDPESNNVSITHA